MLEARRRELGCIYRARMGHLQASGVSTLTSLRTYVTTPASIIRSLHAGWSAACQLSASRTGHGFSLESAERGRYERIRVLNMPEIDRASGGDRRSLGSALEVLATFTRLGVGSFGGPVAHLGYFRAEIVERRQWLDEHAYADLVGLCQFLPGPASSQTGFALGLMRGGYLGGLAAWLGFTLPSAVLLVLFAYGAKGLSHSAPGAGLLHGLKLVAVAIVAQAVWGMARALCSDRQRASIAVLALCAALFAPTSAGQIGAIALGALAGSWFCRNAPGGAPELAEPLAVPISRSAGIGFLVLFAVLLVLLPAFRGLGTGVSLFDAFYRSGALVFGGGHVVLPLLRDAVVTPAWVSDSAFLDGYGAAQAVPGPLFTFAAYLGAMVQGSWGGLIGAVCRPGRHLSPGHPAPDGRPALLGRPSLQATGTGGAPWRRCCRRRAAGRGPLRSGLDQRGGQTVRFRRSPDRVRAAGGLAGATDPGRRSRRLGRPGARTGRLISRTSSPSRSRRAGDRPVAVPGSALSSARRSHGQEGQGLCPWTPLGPRAPGPIC